MCNKLKDALLKSQTILKGCPEYKTLLEQLSNLVKQAETLEYSEKDFSLEVKEALDIIDKLFVKIVN